MIPKIINYCWFGRKPIPTEYLHYMDSWRKYLPDYKIIEWNEDNFDVNCIPFTKEAYDVGKYAYVSDYARLKVLFENGGVYFDTDVEVIRPMDDIMAKGPWMGVEKHTSTPNDDDQVAIGLGFAIEPHNPIIREVMSFYENTHYIFPDGHIEQITVVPIVTDILRKYGLPRRVKKPIVVDGITIYPWDYFCPQEGFQYNEIECSSNTYTIHHYSATWMSKAQKRMMKRGYFFRTNPIGIIIKKLINIVR